MTPLFIVTLSVKNESWILEKSLSTYSLWADHIIILDSGSTDQTLQICRKFPKVQLLPFHESYPHSPFLRRKVLFDAVRNWENTSIVWTLDADEIVSAPILDPQSREIVIKQLQSPGSCAKLPWIMLWKNSTHYRSEPGGIWSNRSMLTLYWDDRKTFIHNDNSIHRSRVPLGFHSRTRSLPQFPLLHYQFVAWERTQHKQAHYRMLDWEKSKKRAIDSLSINTLYSTTRESYGAEVQPLPEAWILPYTLQGIDLDHLSDETTSWFTKAILDQLSKMDPKSYRSYSWLDIWDIPWETYRLKKSLQPDHFSPQKIQDPRYFYHKFYHALIHLAGRYGIRSGLKIYRLIESLMTAINRIYK